ncbi:hypothetical protein D3C87_272570 [compost metagenome]
MSAAHPLKSSSFYSLARLLGDKGFDVINIFDKTVTQSLFSRIPPLIFVYFIDIFESCFALFFNDLYRYLQDGERLKNKEIRDKSETLVRHFARQKGPKMTIF